jgi:Restriction endonuclease NotI
MRDMAKKKSKTSELASTTPQHPLAEVFGFPYNNHSEVAVRHRDHRLCPFNNKVPNCTKDKANDPLGTCSVFHNDQTVITCPIRFRQDWAIATDAAAFFFPKHSTWTSLTEVRLRDKADGAAGNIDVVLVSYNERGRITDFGALEVQAVYISGNVRRPFQKYMEAPEANESMDWSAEVNYPHPDFLSSSRKRLAPQLLYKGGIINAWGKKTAVALDSHFFRTLPKLKVVSPAKAEMAWLVYDLVFDQSTKLNRLVRTRTVYTAFDSALAIITKSEPGKIEDFITVLQDKLDEKLEDNNPPDAPTLDQVVGG